MDVVLASSPVEADVGCWDLQTGAEQIRFRGCGSPSPHGLASIAGRFLAASQIGNISSSSGSILYWSWDKPQVEVKSFPAESILPLASDPDGNYLLGGGSSGNIYLWEIGSGKLLKRWQAHYMAVSCLVFMDQCIIISGSDDGFVRVWNLLSLFGERENEAVKDPFVYSFQEHALRVTDIVSGYGLCNSIAISSSEDRTCKVWSLAKGKMLRSITFPSIINALALDPGESVFYAGGRDGKIYVVALTADHTSNGKYDKYILNCLNEHSKAVTCLETTNDGLALVSGSEDGTVRVWEIKSQRVIRVLKSNEGPVNNMIIIRLPGNPKSINKETISTKSQHMRKLPALDRNIDLTGVPGTVRISPTTNSIAGAEIRYCSSRVMMNTIRELQQKSSFGAMEMELDRLREEQRQCSQMLQKRKKLFEDLWRVRVDKLLDKDQD